MIARACLDKDGMGRKAAMSVEARQRRQGKDVAVSAYRCPFSSKDHHWHVGHVPSIETVASIADAVRDLHGNLPTRVDRSRETP